MEKLNYLLFQFSVLIQKELNSRVSGIKFIISFYQCDEILGGMWQWLYLNIISTFMCHCVMSGKYLFQLNVTNAWRTRLHIFIRTNKKKLVPKLILKCKISTDTDTCNMIIAFRQTSRHYEMLLNGPESNNSTQLWHWSRPFPIFSLFPLSIRNGQSC